MTAHANNLHLAVTVVILVLSANVSSRGIFSRSDDTNPNNAVIQTMASRLSALEAQFTVQEQKMKVLEDQLNRKVAFTVQMAEGTSGTVAEGGLMPFNKVMLNIGDAYNQHSLSFTPPYDGSYWLYARVDDTGDFRSFEMRVNGHGVNRCDNDGGMRSTSCGVVVSLKHGDTVTVNHVELGTPGGHVDPGPESLFAGFLIK